MDESLPELFLFTAGVKSLLFFRQVIFDFLKPTNKNTADLLITNAIGAEQGWVSGEKQAAGSCLLPGLLQPWLHAIKNRGWACVPNIWKPDDSLKNVIFYEYL